jgi:hypothetical protein
LYLELGVERLLDDITKQIPLQPYANRPWWHLQVQLDPQAQQAATIMTLNNIK